MTRRKCLARGRGKGRGKGGKGGKGEETGKREGEAEEKDEEAIGGKRQRQANKAKTEMETKTEDVVMYVSQGIYSSCIVSGRRCKRLSDNRMIGTGPLMYLYTSVILAIFVILCYTLLYFLYFYTAILW